MADTVKVTVDLKRKRVSCPPLVFKQWAACKSPCCRALRRELWSMVDKKSVNAATETKNHRWSTESPFADPLKMEIQ
jgi:hypothetical protein